jgi:hypothetical protein
MTTITSTTSSAQRELTSQLAGQVAAALGERWQAENIDDSRDRIRNDETGETLLVGRFYDTPAGKLSLRGVLPRRGTATYYRRPNPVINVAIRRGPEVIAAEISRRLLPGYRDALAEAVTQCEHVDARAAQTEQLAARLVDALDGGFTRAGGRTGAEVIGRAGEIPVEAEVYGEQVASLVLRQVPAGLACALLAQLARICSDDGTDG